MAMSYKVSLNGNLNRNYYIKPEASKWHEVSECTDKK